MRLAAALAIVVLAYPLSGARADAATDCSNGSDLSRQIRGCTRVINATASDEIVAVAYMNRGVARAARHEFKKALEDLSESLRIEPNNATALYNRGNVHFDLGRYAAAIEDFSATLKLEPDFALAYFNRGLAQERLGNRPASLSDYRAALAIDPVMPGAVAGLKRLEPQP